ncbi:hypothetical protein Pla110_43000 [Polystyrenella longa]|uniref:Uncharacterized protein n=1 Tax=Polystyrenella longa TaxID=2528007 RepID=A0A518CTH8_9PLAN|nr:hypothetical protein [Polystyrenella longa]QDU82542.1 hypothetical protein Pla110_43000 [Polystyrenella longa]
MQKYKTGILFSLVIVFLIVVCIRLMWQVTILSVENAFVQDFVYILYLTEDQVIDGELTAEKAAAFVESYYPVGSKLRPNTVPAKVVETIRSRVLERINRLGQDNVTGEEHKTEGL